MDADRLEKRVERQLKRAKDAFSEGKDRRGERNKERAKKNIEELKDIVGEQEFKTNPKYIEFQKEETDISNIDWEKEIDIVSNKLGKKIKISDLKYIKKFKIKGDEISKDELISFLKTVKEFADKNWESLKDFSDKKEYMSSYTDLTIDINSKLGKILFRYKEKINDKIKLYVDKDIFTTENKQGFLNEIDTLIGSERLQTKVGDKYKQEKDDIKPSVLTASSVPVIPKVMQQSIKETTEKIDSMPSKYNTGFVNGAVNILVEEDLYKGVGIGHVNVNEDKIYDYLVTKNMDKLVCKENVDAICRNYLARTMKSNEAWYSGIARTTQNLVSKKPEGFAKDMMFAFNTDKQKVTEDMTKVLKDMAAKITRQLEKEIVAYAREVENVNSQLTKGLGMVGGSVLVNKAVKSASLAKKAYDVTGDVKGLERISKAKSLYKTAAAMSDVKKVKDISRFSKAFSVIKNSFSIGGWVKNTAMVLRGISTAAKAVPLWGWVLTAGIELGFLWFSIDAQQKQVSIIFSLMFLSNSEVFKNELRNAGINIPDIQIKINEQNILSELNQETGIKERHIRRYGEYKKI